MKVIKRNGTVVPYDESKIAIAITKAFLAVEGPAAAASGRIHQTVSKLTAMVAETFRRRMPSGGSIHIEDIQDQVELALMRAGEHGIARSYVIYREDRARERAARKAPAVEDIAQEAAPEPAIQVVHPDGSRRPLDLERLRVLIGEACAGLHDVEPQLILDETLRNLYDGVSAADLNTALVITARTLVESEPNYTYATARLLLDGLRAEALSFLGVAEAATQQQMGQLYPAAFKAYIAKGVALELIDRNSPASIWTGSAPPSSPSAISSSPTWACKPSTIATSCTAVRSASNCRSASSCAWPWAWPSTSRTARRAPSSSTTCCRRSTT